MTHLVEPAPRPCALCGSRSYRLRFRGAVETGERLLESTLYRSTETDRLSVHSLANCTDCGHIYALGAESEEQLRQAYGQVDDPLYLAEFEHRVRRGEEVLGRLETLRSPGRLLDVGCSAGAFLEAARRRRWQGTGIEPSRWAVRHARQERGLDVLQGTFEEISLRDEGYHAVIMGDVLEHMANPRGAIREVARLLSPLGVLWISTPNIASTTARILGKRWYGIVPAHLHYFTPGSLARLVEDCGLRVVSIDTHGRTFSAGYWATRLASYYGPRCSVLQSLAKSTRLRDLPIHINLGDQMELMAQKR